MKQAAVMCVISALEVQHRTYDYESFLAKGELKQAVTQLVLTY